MSEVPINSRKYVDFVIHLYQPSYQPPFAGGSTSAAYGNRSNRRMHRSSRFEVPLAMTDFGSGSGMLISLSILYQPFYQPLFTGRAMAGVSTTAATSGSTSMHMPISTVSTLAETRTSTTRGDQFKERQGMYSFGLYRNNP